MTKRFEFDTGQEAQAFYDGVNYVNDSSITLCPVYRYRGKWWVRLLDGDRRD